MRAYAFWSGELFNKGRAAADKVTVDITHAALKDGRLCEDGQWRQIVTVMDAIAGGCDLFDINQLRLDYSPEEFANLLMCAFIDAWPEHISAGRAAALYGRFVGGGGRISNRSRSGRSGTARCGSVMTLRIPATARHWW